MSQTKLDLGISTGKKEGEYPDENYEVIYLSDMKLNDEFEGEIFITDIKTKKIKGKDIHTFYVIITDNDEEKKLIAGLNTSAYWNKDIVSIYGAKEGRVYEFIDTFNHQANGTELNKVESYSVNFETFRENINETVEKIRVMAVQSPNLNAKAPNLHVEKIKIFGD